MNRPLTNQQIILEDSKRTILERHPSFASELFDFLQRDQSTICYAKIWDGHGGRLGAMRVAPSSAISNQFGISLEIPVLLATFSGPSALEPRILRHLDTSTQLRGSTTADKDIAILVAADQRAHEFVRDRKRFAFPILVLQANDLAQGLYRTKTLRTELAALMRSTNHFDFSNEIQSSADFFGRIEEIDALTSLVASGQSVGIFGLRRAGKTSLLYRVAEALKDRGVETTYVQLNAMIDADNLRESIVGSLARLARNLGRRLPANSEMLNRDGSIRSSPTVTRRWIYEADALLDVIGKDIALLIDETDLANEDAAEFDDSEITERRTMNRVLQQLRGLIQLRNDRGQTKLSFLSAGVAASIYTSAIRFGRDNQLFGFATARSLGPMTRDEMRQMVRSLGKRSGLKFASHELFDALFVEYGGHPHLTRKACSIVAERVQAANTGEVPYRVALADLELAFRYMGEDSPAYAAWQTFRSFERWYPEEGALVAEILRTGRPSPDVDKITHAIGFGLCDEHGALRMGALRRSA